MEKYVGKTITFTAPSGHTFTIREQNGDDDETLSLVDENKKEESFKNLNMFLTSIISKNSFTGSNSIDLDQLMKLKLVDKYYILLKSRIHTMGKNLKVKLKCPICKKEYDYKEDLGKYDTDLAIYASRKDEDKAKDYKYQIVPHKGGKNASIEFPLSSGKIVKYDYLTVDAELEMIKLSKVSKNTDLYLRNLALKDGTEYVQLGMYNVFSKMDMIEINKHIQENDPQFMMFMEVECGNKECKHFREIPFLYLPDFFFPGEI